MQTEQLIQNLLNDTKLLINEAQKLKSYELKKLTWRESENSWCVLECLQHLNLYGNYYIPEITKEIKNSNSYSELDFKPGFLGDYFAKSMLPKDKLNKMKTFKDKNPIYADLSKSVIDKFIDHQYKIIELLETSKNVSLNKVRIKTTITSLIRLKLGDMFRFLINHNIRHMNQAKQVIAQFENSY